MALNILLVEDNESTKKMIELTFDNEDVEVSTLEDTEDALEKIKGLSPDIIILDEDIQGMKGIDLCREIKKDYMFKTTPVILLSSWTGEDTKENAAEGVITKPFKSIEIINMVSKLTGKSFKSSSDSEADSSMNSSEEEDSSEMEELDFARLERGDAILKLDINDELSKDNDISEVTRSVEIFPEEILDEDEKKIDFSNILGDDDDDIDINSKPFTGRNRKQFGSNIKDVDDNMSRLQEEVFNNARNNINDANLTKAILNKFLGEKIESGLQKVVDEITKDVLKEVMEKSLREVMEKSFKSISQQILKQIEQVSWEVVPDLAEVLIKKEIEKLKEETESSSA